jgi:hypothetical protein
MTSESRRGVLWLLSFSLLSSVVVSCASSNPVRALAIINTPSQLERAPVNSVSVIHVFVALADNVNQGIVPGSGSV